MEDHPNAVEDFIRLFSRNTNQGDTHTQVSQFAATFLAAGPQGANCVRNQDFALALPKRKRLFESLGCQSTDLMRIEVESLDERYSIARTQWKMTFSRLTTPQEIVVDSSFIVDIGVHPFQIVLYLAHQDIMSIMKDRGILMP